MQIPVNKTTLASALTALGKLVSRTSLIRAFQGIEIEGLGNILFFRTRNIIEQIEFRLFADLEDDFPPVLVEFEQFRQTVRNCKKKDLEIEVDCGEVFIDGVKLAPVKGRFPAREIIPDQDVTITELPADTLSALSLLAPVADKGADSRDVLSGINISRDGFTATNGKELLNIPLPLEMNGSVTIPFPLVLLATKAFAEAGRLTTWQKDEDKHFELTLGAWAWRGKAFKENYPNWKRVVPERNDTTHYVSFQDDRAEKLQRYLKSIPDDRERNNGVRLSRLPEVPDNLHLESSNGMLFSILAEFDPNWGDLSFSVRKEFLLRLLDAGHRKIELNDSFGPIVGTGGTGQYVAMPLYVKNPKHQTVQATEQAETQPEQPASVKTDTKAAIQPEQTTPRPVIESTESVPVQNPTHPQESQTTISNTTTSIKENPTMNENINITHTVSAPVQTYTQNHESAKELNPLDELTAKIEGMKAAIKEMFDEAAVISRKVREVALAQRQKEREYQQTKRTIERIRTASGF